MPGFIVETVLLKLGLLISGFGSLPRREDVEIMFSLIGTYSWSFGAVENVW